jgi:hypothetical protein
MSYVVEKEWITKAGLRAFVVLNSYEDSFESRTVRFRCGYVAVGPDSMLYGKKYTEKVSRDLALKSIEAETEPNRRGSIVTLQAIVASSDEDRDFQIDHVINVHGGLTFGEGKTEGKYPAEYSGATLFGFDAHHYGDSEIVCDTDYMAHECEDLAEQLVALSCEIKGGGV